ncbi:uroporphyrinogen decarboxylase [Bartonella sp. DGB1]|uniref:uroporphyrinogen decarboxylase n=1 Tax=Bartonella sp. DGB1 TaxID=3239807 RepID=UPI0035251483
MKKKLLQTINGQKQNIPPIWFMRQAGRYLLEYRNIRKKVDSFLELCYNPILATEVTLQPINRFDLDAAIIFADILVIPHSLGINLTFKENEGPILEQLTIDKINKLEKNINKIDNILNPIYQTIENVKQKLSKEKTLIGFCGAPWTIATYMINGKTSKDHIEAKKFAMQYPNEMKNLISIITEASANYLIKQIDHGCDLVQIFDSWSNILDENNFEEYCIKPVAKIVKKVKEKYPNVPIIGFPKGCGAFYKNYATKTKVDVLSIDWAIPFDFAKSLQNETIIQGNLDPVRLLVGGQALHEGVLNILDNFNDKPFIFNLGHGILPTTPIKNVETMINLIRTYNKGN